MTQQPFSGFGPHDEVLFNDLHQPLYNAVGLTFQHQLQTFARAHPKIPMNEILTGSVSTLMTFISHFLQGNGSSAGDVATFFQLASGYVLPHTPDARRSHWVDLRAAEEAKS